MSELDVIFELSNFENTSKHHPNMKIFIKFTALGAQSEFLRLAGLGRRITLQSLYALRVIVWNCESPERLNSFSALAEKILFSTPHFSHFPAFSGWIL